MAQLAPGRLHDMAMLVKHRDSAPFNSIQWRRAQVRIEDLVEEGKCHTVVSLRKRLVGASVAQDDPEVERISRQIEDHVKRKHPKRFYRQWAKG